MLVLPIMRACRPAVDGRKIKIGKGLARPYTPVKRDFLPEEVAPKM